MPEYIKIAKVSEVAPGQGKAIKLDGMNIAVFNDKGTFYAVDDFCTHKGAPLSNGMLGNKSITCEWHGATFDLETGKVLNGPAGSDITAYRVRVNGDDLEIVVE